jgi:CubicO group peptidase (beta-lactamase class C family)
MTRRGATISAGIVLASALLQARAGQQTDLGSRIQSLLEERYAKAGYPGITVSVVMPDDRVYTAAAGWADRDHTTKLDPASRMPAGSVGKTFVATAVLQAVDTGTLALDDKSRAMDRTGTLVPASPERPGAHAARPAWPSQRLS